MARPAPRRAATGSAPLSTKLGIRPGMRVALVDAPDGVERTLEPLPPAVELRREGRGRVDLVVAFISQREYLPRVIGLRSRIPPDGALWVAWPKRSSGLDSDMTDDAIREIALPLGLVDNKVCAIDATWSALRLVLRRQLRPS